MHFYEAVIKIYITEDSTFMSLNNAEIFVKIEVYFERNNVQTYATLI